MRPGRLTPENSWPSKTLPLRCFSFNEAGAINPGKPAIAPRAAPIGIGFNEAGAINPGKPVRVGAVGIHAVAASMRPGRLTPENRAATGG